MRVIQGQDPLLLLGVRTADADHQCDSKEVKLAQWEIDKYVSKRYSKHDGSSSGYLFEH